jgi:pimeloyl-ACP methyl ester carboxylesterase
MEMPVHTDHLIKSSIESGLTLKLRERFMQSEGQPAGKVPLLMVHGATIPSLLWDHPIADWSWMNRFARDGFHVYALDVRGYGGSSRATVLDALDPENHPPYARAVDVQQDIEDAIVYIAKRHGVDQVDLLGGSWGSITCGLFASSQRARHIRRLVLYAPIYDEGHTKTSWWHGAVDPNDQTKVNPKLGAYRWVTHASLINRWDAEIPFEDKSIWRPTEVFDALFDACLKEDPASAARQPAAFRAPNGTLVDLFGAYTGRPVFDAKNITVPTLLIRGDHDDTSSRIGSLKLFDEIRSQTKVYVEVGNGAHFVILENQAPKVHQAVSSFLNEID